VARGDGLAMMLLSELETLLTLLRECAEKYRASRPVLETLEELKNKLD
jgi:hypothetical protein